MRNPSKEGTITVAEGKTLEHELEAENRSQKNNSGIFAGGFIARGDMGGHPLFGLDPKKLPLKKKEFTKYNCGLQ